MKKKLIREYPWEDEGKKISKCDQIGCQRRGEYKAPKSVSSKETYNFCLEHVKKYNMRWDFFAGKSQDQIYMFLKNDIYNNKPTRPMSDRVSSKINFEFNFGDFFDLKKENINRDNLSNELNEALDIFKIKIPFNSIQLKKKYNNLVKKNHPDLYGGDKKKDAKLKKINIYYKILQKIAT